MIRFLVAAAVLLLVIVAALVVMVVVGAGAQAKRVLPSEPESGEGDG